VKEIFEMIKEGYKILPSPQPQQQTTPPESIGQPDQKRFLIRKIAWP
jgi:hypothetical protein